MQPGRNPQPDQHEILGSLNYERFFDQYFNKTDRGALIVNRDRQILLMNEAATSLLAYNGSLPAPLLAVVHDVEIGFAVEESLRDCSTATIESFAPDPDRLLKYHLVPIQDGGPDPVLLLISIEDITRLRHLETVRRDFVANVSHELRTPITSINLLVETLLEGAISDPEAAEHFLQRIQVETHSMARLVEELLELSRLESGRLALTLEPMDVREVIEYVVDRLAPSARDKSLDVDVDIPEVLPPVMADQGRIEQVLLNLVHNAIKFTPSGGDITVRAARKGRGVQIEVSDNGVGMDPAEAARIFERFYKVDRGRNRAQGTGLGLAIVRHLLELHGTQLLVVSEPGRGSRFSFALPVSGG